MRSVNKFEAIGIFGSITVMAIALVLLRTEFTPSDASTATAQVSDSGVVVVDPNEESEDDEADLANALIDNATLNGELNKLIIDDLVVGTGDTVEKGDTVTVHYIGRTQEGVEFDNSYNRGTPFTFTVGEGKVIPGWEVGLLDMMVGGERILVIPSDMAYGELEVGPIKANSILIFKVELLEIK